MYLFLSMALSININIVIVFFIGVLLIASESHPPAATNNPLTSLASPTSQLGSQGGRKPGTTSYVDTAEGEQHDPPTIITLGYSPFVIL